MMEFIAIIIFMSIFLLPCVIAAGILAILIWLVVLLVDSIKLARISKEETDIRNQQKKEIKKDIQWIVGILVSALVLAAVYWISVYWVGMQF